MCVLLYVYHIYPHTYVCCEPTVGTISNSQLEEFDKDLEQVGLLQILKVNAKEWPFIALGILGSFIEGIGLPLFAIFFGEVLTVSVADTQHAMHGCIDMYVCAGCLVNECVQSVPKCWR